MLIKTGDKSISIDERTKISFITVDGFYTVFVEYEGTDIKQPIYLTNSQKAALQLTMDLYEAWKNGVEIFYFAQWLQENKYPNSEGVNG